MERKIFNYKNRFYKLMESELGDVKPLSEDMSEFEDSDYESKMEEITISEEIMSKIQEYYLTFGIEKTKSFIRGLLSHLEDVGEGAFNEEI